jgi:hypothetical protein
VRRSARWSPDKSPSPGKGGPKRRLPPSATRRMQAQPDPEATCSAQPGDTSRTSFKRVQREGSLAVRPCQCCCEASSPLRLRESSWRAPCIGDSYLWPDLWIAVSVAACGASALGTCVKARLARAWCRVRAFRRATLVCRFLPLCLCLQPLRHRIQHDHLSTFHCTICIPNHPKAFCRFAAASPFSPSSRVTSHEKPPLAPWSQLALL